MSQCGPLAASVVVVSDFASGSEQGRADVRRALRALAAQDFDGPVEYILVESESLRAEVPSDLIEILPSLRVVFSPSCSSYELRNDGVREARCELVGTLDADCTPDPGWVRCMVESLARHPDVAAVSGRTHYAGGTLLSRLAGAIERSYVDGDTSGATRHFSTSAAGVRRSVYLEHPLPTSLGPFASRVQSEAMQRSGWRLLFDRRMRVTHAFYPGFFATYHYNVGYGTLRVRLEDARLRHAWLARLGYLSVPVFFAGRLLNGCMRALRSWRDYDIRWYELPAVFVVSIAGCLLEIPGMIRALRGAPPPATLFR